MGGYRAQRRRVHALDARGGAKGTRLRLRQLGQQFRRQTANVAENHPVQGRRLLPPEVPDVGLLARKIALVADLRSDLAQRPRRHSPKPGERIR